MQCLSGGLAVKSLFIRADGISRLCAAGALARRPGASRQTGGLPAQHVGQVECLSPVLRFSPRDSGWRRSKTRPKRALAGDLSEERHGRGGEREDRGGHFGATALARLGGYLQSSAIGRVEIDATEFPATAVLVCCVNRCLCCRIARLLVTTKQ